MDTFSFCQQAPPSLNIQKTIMTLATKLDFDGVCLVSVSGGSDSDILIDLIERSDKKCKVIYVFFDTGIEYFATKEHLDYLEKNYNIVIERQKAAVPVPLGVKRYGVPFLSKQVSNFIARLQSKNYSWSLNSDFANDITQFPKAKAGLKWWHNNWGSHSHFNIERNRLLKEYMSSSPPPLISDKCCEGAKNEPLTCVIQFISLI